jgi:hypothetical protein
MDRRIRAIQAWPALLAVTLGALALGPAALADSTNDINDWNMTEAVSQAGGGTQFHIGSGSSGLAQYRWLDSPNKSTVVSANDCADLHVLGSVSSYGVGDTSYHGLFTGIAGTCFILQGRTQAGQGSMVNHDGRVSR